MKTYLNDFWEPVLVFSIGGLFVLAIMTAFVGESLDQRGQASVAAQQASQVARADLAAVKPLPRLAKS